MLMNAGAKNLRAGLKLHRLRNVRGRVAFDGRLAVLDLQHHVVGQRHGNRIVVEHHQLAVHSFFQQGPLRRPPGRQSARTARNRCCP